MSEHFQKFLHLKLQIRFCRTSKIAASPSTPFPMRHRSTDGTLGGVEKCIHMRVDLGYDGKSNSKMQIQGLERDICPKAMLVQRSTRLDILKGTDLPSFHLWPNEYGDRLPSWFFAIITTGFRIPGTAAEASTADQITQSGAVR